MHGNQSKQAERPAAGESTGATFFDEDMVFARWIEIAAVAWEGFQFAGPGAVCIRRIDGQSRVAYYTGSLCNCHPVRSDTYDPMRQVVVFTSESDCRPVVLEGWPTPPEAFGLFNVEIHDLNAN